ncbi:hypothetical protein IWX76_000150 [Pedobacter sp. CAN_A7]|uniref:hypothetical protein n=1 Tax=Pedobacter sp. CAN_A7 TaxID=2787722 RepID=UPI0018C95961
MTTTENFTTQPTHPASLGKRMLQGGTVALILISIFLMGAGEPNPEWGKLWMIRPLIIVPLAGAVGGAFYYVMDSLRYRGDLAKIAANVLSLIVYIIGLWMGTVLGLDGTMWN